MCSFIFANRSIPAEANRISQLRGPDRTSIQIDGDYRFLHNLLSITGQGGEQPFIDQSGDVYCLFVGEIYNHTRLGNYKTDGECLLPLYKRFGRKMFSYLHGEWAICIVDLKKNQALVATDIFGTKPLYCAHSQPGVATYGSALGAMGISNFRLEANTAMVFDLETWTPIEVYDVWEFDFNNQVVESYEYWGNAFEEAVIMRGQRGVTHPVFVGLSSGYDSGAIACALNLSSADFSTYSLWGKENRNVLQARFGLLDGPADVIEATDEIRAKGLRHIEQHVEPFQYTIRSADGSYDESWNSLLKDNGSTSLSVICDRAKRDGQKIHLSGAGADELYSDYGHNGQRIYPHSNFGGHFPQDLNTIFPSRWISFYGSSMESYLAKDEYVGSSYGLETRYPFLDRDVVQEFLWLTPELKNRHYKAPLHYYLDKHSFPFAPGEKVGF